MRGSTTLTCCLVVLAAGAFGVALDPSESVAQQDASKTDCPDVATPETAIRVEGSVRELGSDLPLYGADVELTWREGDELRRIVTTTDSTGRYRICRLAPDRRYTLTASALGRTGTMHPLDTRPEQSEVRQDLTVALTETESGQIVGRVVDGGSGRGVEAATVRLEPSGLEVVTRYDGRFTFRDVSPGDHILHLRHLAYGEHETEVTVEPDRTIDVEMAVSEEPVELEPLEVTVRHRYRPLERRGYYERMHSAEAHGGEFITPEIIERRQPSRVSHLLEGLPGLRMVGSCRGSVCGAFPVFRENSGCRARASQIGSHTSVPQIYVDGVKFDIQQTAKGIDQITAGSVRAIEVYKSPSQMPAEFIGSDSRCGVIAIWTKKGPDRERPGG